VVDDGSSIVRDDVFRKTLSQNIEVFHEMRMYV